MLVVPGTMQNIALFVQTLESPGIKTLRFPGLESPVKGKGPGSPGILR